MKENWTQVRVSQDTKCTARGPFFKIPTPDPVLELLKYETKTSYFKAFLLVSDFLDSPSHLLQECLEFLLSVETILQLTN